MNRIDACFDKLSTGRGGTTAANRKALVCFLTCGDPDFATTVDLVKAISKAGADIVELGVPFSDPLADGPSIQASSFRALEAGATVPKVLDCVAEIRRPSTSSGCPSTGSGCDVPLVLMTYYNPAQKYGLEEFARDAANAGADGVIMTDLPPEEGADWKRAADAAGLETILLVAPTSTKERIELAAKVASGFIYCVSRTGVTGARDQVPAELKDLVARIKSATDLPVVIGFGISKPEHVRQVTEFADGAVVGSALVNIVAEHSGLSDLVDRAAEFVESLKR